MFGEAFTFLPPRSMLTRSALRRAFNDSDLLISIDCLISSLRVTSADARASRELVEEGSDISAASRFDSAIPKLPNYDIPEAKLDPKSALLTGYWYTRTILMISYHSCRYRPPY